MYPPSLLTIGTCNRCAGIATVIRSFLEHHPNGQTFVCLVDRPVAAMAPLDLPGQVFFADAMDLPGGKRFLFQYEAFELCCALKPYALRHVMEKFGLSHVLYLDSDILVINPFWHELENSWKAHSVLLTPHMARLPLDLSPEAQRSVLQHGSYNGGFVALRESDEGTGFLEWWGRMVQNLCTEDTMNNVYADQRWLDLAAASSPAVRIMRDPGLNVAYWNLHERKLEEDSSGRWSSNGIPLKFFHFSGFDRRRLTVKMECSDPAALKLAEIYGNLLQAAGDARFGAFPYGWKNYVDGEPIPARHRDLILIDHPDFHRVADPFLLPQMAREWNLMRELAPSVEPARVTERFNDEMLALSTIRRLNRHPVIGLVWKLWRRFVNPSLGSGLPPHAL